MALTFVACVAWQALRVQREATEELMQISEGQRRLQDGDMMHDALRADLFERLSQASTNSQSDDLKAKIHKSGFQFISDIEELEKLALPSELKQEIFPVKARVESYISTTETIAGLIEQDRARALAAIPAFFEEFEELRQRLGRVIDQFSIAVRFAEERSRSTSDAAGLWIILSAFGAFLLVWFTVKGVSRSVQHSIRQIRLVADSVAAGDLSVRNSVVTTDEIGQLACVFNSMADNLQIMVERVRAEADRDAFGTQLGEALEMADTEAEVYQVVGRAMLEISRELPMELLLADSSRANLERAAEHPARGAPGCGVESPFHCVAVRRGNPVVFETSEALNACTRLRDRPSGPVSAICVPVSFMGRALGALHCTGLALAPPGADVVSQLTTLGIQVGGRIGTVRAFQRTQTRANTDPLTGLMNRRALEDQVRQIAVEGTPYALVVADLDHFKSLNDTNGHEAGDRALRMFSEVVRKTMREGDIAARWGGEEFTFVLPGARAEQALELCERVRAGLAASLETARCARFTSSFGVADSSMAGTWEQQIKLADDALYASKRNGRDRVTVAEAGRRIVPFRQSEPAAAVDVRQMADAMESALEI